MKLLSLSLLAALALGCSGSGEEAQKPAEARPMSAIWPEILAERDKLQTLLAKQLEEVTHEDCKELGASARRIDELMGDVLNAAPSLAESEGQLRAIGDTIIHLQGVTAKIRESALAEAPGQWVDLRFPLDQGLRAVEGYFKPEDLGGQSVVSRPNFETKPQPPPLSPI